VTQNFLTYSFIKAPIRLCTHYKGIEPRLPTYNDFMLMGMLNATHSLTHFRHGSFGMWLCGSTINSPCLANITKAVVTPLTWYLRRSDTHSATVHSWSLVHRRAIHYPPNISLFLAGVFEYTLFRRQHWLSCFSGSRSPHLEHATTAHRLCLIVDCI